ncbi:MAG: hypothetical protein UT30_C0031G0008 [Candidatus Uhrbacteria bacterium GW2011_GWF2_39_13]|uniref:Enoyl reductase (ER) domain-containing protein n=1 Tax=Candidatus Uhrbacteria bacterium GW2011_GWF2_39_13 TaxID=1618995 RepID=A0A0G0QNU3_9BACT|nr:MAG: hypothetical protein UT30_C0031G0008 [Candidatus Uhrbacteria bacterium GW2011_GWF2_39_13]
MKSGFRNGKNYFVKDFQLPQLKMDQVRIKVEACGICGTDVHVVSTKEEQFGHEIAGTVLEAGSAVTTCKAGDKVVLDSATPCGYCDNCHDGKQTLCKKLKTIWGVPSFGFAEEIIAPAISVVQRGELPADIASLAEPLGVALDIFKLTDIKMDNTVLVSGSGPIGLMALRLAKLAGASKIYAADLSASKKRLALAKEFGADEIIEVDKTPLETYKFETAPDRLMITSPPSTLPVMFKICGKAAIISFIGIKFNGDASITFDANDFHFKKLQLRASFASPALYTPEAVRLLSSGRIDGSRLISHRFKLDDIAHALQTAASPESVKVVIMP